MKGAFITATGTGVGKTWLASALTTACVQRGKKVAAIKPIETGVDPDPEDLHHGPRGPRESHVAVAGGVVEIGPRIRKQDVIARGEPRGEAALVARGGVQVPGQDGEAAVVPVVIEVEVVGGVSDVAVDGGQDVDAGEVAERVVHVQHPGELRPEPGGRCVVQDAAEVDEVSPGIHGRRVLELVGQGVRLRVRAEPEEPRVL